MERDVAAGEALREGRMKAGWGAEQSARFYGCALRGVPITRKAYLRMEEGYLPKDPKRRAILVGMFGLPPAIFLSQIAQDVREELDVRPSRAINLKSYRMKLLTSWNQGYKGNATDALKDVERRIQALQNTVLYAPPDTQKEMKQLLCGYLMWFASIAREQGNYALALQYYNNAITLAHQEGYTDFEAAAICARGNLYLDRAYLKEALQDFVFAASFQTPSELKGHILSLQSVTEMRLAQTEKDKTHAMKLMDVTENLAGTMSEDQLYMHSFPMGRYLRFRANVFMVAPIKKLRIPDSAIEILDVLDKRQAASSPDPGKKRHDLYHQMECDIAYARIYTHQEYYPIATTLLQDALDLMQQAKTNIHATNIRTIYDTIKTSEYGKTEEFAQLGVSLMKAQYAQVF
jgi:tetratricopeptide (TPR) repeat protein